MSRVGTTVRTSTWRSVNLGCQSCQTTASLLHRGVADNQTTAMPQTVSDSSGRA